MKPFFISLAIASSIIAACDSGSGGSGGGDNSGIDQDTQLADLTPAEVTEFCEFFADSIEMRTIDCGDGFEITIPAPVEQCVEDYSVPDSCLATVGEGEDCIRDLADLTDEQWCNLNEFPSSCEPLFTEECEVDDA